MKWLLITTLGKNVGDEFARIGVQNLIREVDASAEFELLCKESPEIHKPRPFDRAVLCGMPLFWSIKDNECQNIDWWEPIIRGWVSADKRKFMVLGAGGVFVKEIYNFQGYTLAIAEVLRRAWAVTTRQPIIEHPKIMDSVCPAAFATTANAGSWKLCNLMPHGSHHFCLRTQQPDIDAWHKIVQQVASFLISEDFTFIAHNAEEENFARQLGFKNTFFSGLVKPEDYLEIYSSAIAYFGNRLHGAVVSASVGADVFAVSADSRNKMVERVGGETCTPAELRMDRLNGWCRCINTEHPRGDKNFIPGERHLGREKFRLVELLREFAHGK